MATNPKPDLNFPTLANSNFYSILRHLRVFRDLLYNVISFLGHPKCVASQPIFPKGNILMRPLKVTSLRQKASIDDAYALVKRGVLAVREIKTKTRKPQTGLKDMQFYRVEGTPLYIVELPHMETVSTKSHNCSFMPSFMKIE